MTAPQNIQLISGTARPDKAAYIPKRPVRCGVIQAWVGMALIITVRKNHITAKIIRQDIIGHGVGDH